MKESELFVEVAKRLSEAKRKHVICWCGDYCASMRPEDYPEPSKQKEERT